MNEDKVFLAKLAIFIISVCFIYFFAVTFIPLPKSGERFADVILGVLLGSGFTVVIAFFFGSSKGSADKNTTIDRLTDTIPK